MAGTAVGALRTAATRIGVTLDEYLARRAAGEKWCTACKDWHPVEAFLADTSRSDGLTAACRDARNRRARRPPRQLLLRERGQRHVAARDRDVRQARRRVNYLVEIGLLPRPNDLPCADCAHVFAPGQRRHEYDHHLGYSPEHHEHVEPVCTDCHRLREGSRQAVPS